MIKSIYINNFGKLSDIRIFPNEKLNIIYAHNEGGKSTLLEFIKFIFYGSRQKKTKGELTFREKFMPWNGMPMSGNIEVEYKGNSYVIYRSEGAKNGSKELKVENPHTGERYTTIDDPGMFFFGVDEKAFSEVFLSCDSDTFFETGEEISTIVYGFDNSYQVYNRIRKNIDDQILNLVSTKRTGSVYSLVQNEIASYEEKLILNEMESSDLKLRLSQDEARLDSLNDEHKHLKEMLDLAKHDEEDAEFSKLVAQKCEEEENLKQLLAQITLLDSDNDNFNLKDKHTILISVLSFIIFDLVLYSIFNVEKWLLFSAIFVVLLAFLLVSVRFIKRKKKIDEKSDDNYQSVLLNQIKLSEKRIADCDEKIRKYTLSHNNTNFADVTNFDIRNTFTKDEINDIINKIRVCETNISVLDTSIKSASVRFQELVADKEYYMQKIASLREKLAHIDYKVSVLKVAGDILDSSFFAMRDMIAPKISQRAFDIFGKVSGSGYSSLVANDKFEVSINADGVFKNVKNFSRSTRDLADLALRIAICDSLSGDYSVPLFFDDILSSFDDERCSRMLECINAISKDRQIFLCSCRMREVVGADSETMVIRLGEDDENG